MIKLIKLEYKKHKIGKYITMALALTVLLAIFIFAMTYLGIAYVLLISVTQGSIGSLSLSGNMYSSIILIAISIFCAFLCVAKIDTNDVVGGK